MRTKLLFTGLTLVFGFALSLNAHQAQTAAESTGESNESKAAAEKAACDMAKMAIMATDPDCAPYATAGGAAVNEGCNAIGYAKRYKLTCKCERTVTCSGNAACTDKTQTLKAEGETEFDAIYKDQKADVPYLSPPYGHPAAPGNLCKNPQVRFTVKKEKRTDITLDKGLKTAWKNACKANCRAMLDMMVEEAKSACEMTTYTETADASIDKDWNLLWAESGVSRPYDLADVGYSGYKVAQVGYPAPSPTYSPTPSPTYTPYPSPTYSPTPSPTYTPYPSPTYSPTPTPTYTPYPSPTYSPTPSPTYEPPMPTYSPPPAPPPAPPPMPTESPEPKNCTASLSAYKDTYGSATPISWMAYGCALKNLECEGVAVACQRGGPYLSCPHFLDPPQ